MVRIAVRSGERVRDAVDSSGLIQYGSPGRRFESDEENDSESSPRYGHGNGSAERDRRRGRSVRV